MDLDTTKVEAEKILEEARTEATRILKDTRTFVEATHAVATTPLSFICRPESKLGNLLDHVLGDAKFCYCCSAIRLGLIAFAGGALAGAIVEAMIAHTI